MPSANTTLEYLITEFREGRLKVPALFAALSERGPVADEQHQSEVAWLQQQREAGDLDAQVAKGVLSSLERMQASDNASGVGVDEEDVTRVQVPSPPPVADDDATRVVPVTGSSQEDGTVFAPPPAAADSGHDSATVVRPATHSGNTDSSTPGNTSTGTVNTSTWKRVASEEGGEFATVGMLLKGRFLLERELGRGGMGVVYLARDERKVEARDRDPYVAVKVLNDEFRRHPDSLISLQRESRRSQQLAHDNIVRVYDFDKDRTIVYMTMEYIAGTNLKTLIREQAYDGMPMAKARPLIEGMARALGRAHGTGVVHSDFKPGNVMVTEAGEPKVFDFGIARAGKFVGEAGEETVFDAGTLGALTPAYASLEMMHGAEPQPTDDIYALGCVIYELLTGQHPFDKASAEVVLKEGRKPPQLTGLTRRQNKTLASAVALHAEQRLKNVQELIEGLREVGWAERARPYFVYGAIAVVLLGAGGWGVSHYLDVQHINTVIGRLAPDSPQHYANEDKAYAALVALGPDQSKRVVVDYSSVLQTYLLERLDAYWNPAKKRYDYAGVQHVFKVRDELKLFSPKLDVRRSAIEQERNTLLNTLDTQLSDRIAAGAIFANQPNNVVETLTAIEAIDPKSPLLHNTELELKYDRAIGRSLDAGKLAVAKQQLATASHWYPQSKRLAQWAEQLDMLEKAYAMAHGSQAKQTLPEARAALQKLLADPSLVPAWRTSVAASMATLKQDQSAQTRSLRKQLVGVIAVQAAQAGESTEVAEAEDLVDLGLVYAPQAKPLLEQKARLAALHAKQELAMAKESAAAEVSSRIGSAKRAAAAHDVDKVRESLARIKTLDPGNDFLKRQGPQLLADAWLGSTQQLVDAGKYRQAANLLGKAERAMGRRSDLSQARARLDFVADLMAARNQPLTSAAIDGLHKRLQALQQADASALAALGKRMRLHGGLPSDSLADLVNTLKPKAEVAKASAPPPPAAEPEKPAVVEKPAASVAAATNPSPDPCARAGLVGSGRACLDRFAGIRGPAMVVIPGAGGKTYAMSRAEITVREFGQFCSATHQCSAPGGAASVPVTHISLAQAKAYAAWLSQVTGHDYRLPTNAEWTHAAQAGQGWSQSPDSNCIPPSGGGGAGGPIPARGRQPNPWGLVNMTGNVWEWVTSGSSVMIRGGGYDSYWSECSVASQRTDNGKPKANVGFRVLRGVR